MGDIIAIIVVVAIIVVAVVAAIAHSNRQRELRRRFGPEYDRLVAEFHSRRKAEAELTERQRHVRDLNLRPLDQATQARYADEWTAVQAHFVDAPEGAVLDAQRLMMTLMNERGYPTEHEDQIIADLSVDHAKVLDHYRVASHAAQDAAGGTASTEDLRQAMIHYRVLFRDLVGDSGAPDEAEMGALTAGNGSAPAVTSRFRPRAAANPAPAETTPAEAEPTSDQAVPDQATTGETHPGQPTVAETAGHEPGPAGMADDERTDDEPRRADIAHDTDGVEADAHAAPTGTAADETDPAEAAPPENQPGDAARRAG
jgi:hypothetical protein